ncbi:hypothetical protein H4582DRAFT_278628 [Lactarius indigo]|nr:hypothetical protein H4582DRAFT_278628 [Lactarius indigo]
MSIWLLLVDHTFRTPIGEHFGIGAISDRDTIDTLKKKIKEKWQNRLANVDAAELTVWKTKGAMAINESTFENLAEILGDINVDDKDTIEKLSPSQRVANLGLSDGGTLLVQLPVTTNAGNNDSEAMEVMDTLPKLKEYDRYNKIVVTPGLLPSDGAKSAGYRKIQATDALAIYDGRMVPDSPLSTFSPPVQIFHPIFNDFIRSVNDSKVQPTTDDLKHVYKFMSIVSDISGSEKDYSNRLLPQLRLILNADVHEERSPDGTRPDGVITLQLGNSRIAYFFLDLKREIGEGGCDPNTQVSLSMRRFWIDESKRNIRDRCCCPTFLVAAAGPWLSVLGAVFTDKIITQRLTSMKWMALSSTEEDSRVYHNARVFVSLRDCLSNLKTFYETLDGVPPIVPNLPHPRYFPYPSSFTSEDGSVINFRYLQSLEVDAACVTYLAETLPNARKVVVKFVSRYGKEVHEFLAHEGYAPLLLYHGALPEIRLPCVLPGPTQSAPSNLHLRPDLMHMVVMDYIDPRPDAPRDVSAQIETILNLLHSEGYVFGDLRKPNILFDADGKVKLIDFDWCGRYNMEDVENLPEDVLKHIDQNKMHVQAGDESNDYAHYPLSMSTVEGMWALGMEPLAPIRPMHDRMMFQKLSW